MGAQKTAKKKTPKKIAAPRPDSRTAAPAYARFAPVVVAATPNPQITFPAHGDVVSGTVTFQLTTNNAALNHYLVVLDANGVMYDPPGMIPVDFSNGSPATQDIDFTDIPNGTPYTFRIVCEHPAGRTSHEIDVTVG